MAITKLHRHRTTGEWVPCAARTRPCPREHLNLNEAGDRVDLLADVRTYQAQLAASGKSVNEQLADVRARIKSISAAAAPYEQAEQDLREERQRLITLRWEQAAPRDYVAANDYAGLQALMEDAFSNRAASTYMRANLNLGSPHLTSEGYVPRYMVPGVRISAPYGLDDAALDTLAVGASRWANFLLDNRDNPSNDRYKPGPDSPYAREDAADEVDHVSLRVFDRHLGEQGIPAVRIYRDGTAAGEITVYGTTRPVDEHGQELYRAGDIAKARRKPLRALLAEMNRYWYYPAESNPDHLEDLDPYAD